MRKRVTARLTGYRADTSTIMKTVGRLLKSVSTWQLAVCVLGAVVSLWPAIWTSASFWGLEWQSTGGRTTVRRVLRDSPAETSGLRKGDVISAVEGNGNDFSAVHRAVYALEPGDTATFDVKRGEWRETRCDCS